MILNYYTAILIFITVNCIPHLLHPESLSERTCTEPKRDRKSISYFLKTFIDWMLKQLNLYTLI